ncbi:MAG: hypothetical protein JWP63_6693, partial [Candidatus Solibacter sp.]|nr:hypothetical protein [Candidatus Solibacter sp.]
TPAGNSAALLFLQDIDIDGRLAVVDEDKIRIRR